MCKSVDSACADNLARITACAVALAGVRQAESGQSIHLEAERAVRPAEAWALRELLEACRTTLPTGAGRKKTAEPVAVTEWMSELSAYSASEIRRGFRTIASKAPGLLGLIRLVEPVPPAPAMLSRA
ncbi:MAG: hypothetical protein JWM34_1079 [Ilumatobacteraceae bacterium]|nr:hypothetical protein [Ilumatobacteraceae bacterium]